MAITWTNTTEISYSTALVPSDSPITKLSGAGVVQVYSVAPTFYGQISHVAGGVLVFRPTSNGQIYFDPAQTTTWDIAGNNLDVVVNNGGVTATTMNCNFTGAGGFGPSSDVSTSALVLTINGSVSGMTGYSVSDSNAIRYNSFNIYDRGGAVLRDLPRQLSMQPRNADLTCTVNVPIGASVTNFNTTTVVVDSTITAVTSLISNSGYSAFSFGNPTTGSFRKVVGTGTVTFDLSGSNTGDNTMSNDSVISAGTASLRKSGAGKWILAGNNSAFTATALQGGTLQAANSNALGGALTMSASTVFALSGNISLSPTTTLNGISTIRNVSGNNTLGSALTLTGQTTFDSLSGTLTLTTGTISGAGQNIIVSGASNVTINSVVGTTTGTLTKNDAGTLTLAGVNTFSGIFTANGGTVVANTLASSTSNSLGTGPLVFGSGSTAIIRYTGSSSVTLTKNMTFSGTTSAGFENNGTGSITVSPAVTTVTGANGIALGGTNTGYNSFSVTLTGGSTSGTGYTKTGAGRWIVTGSNDMTGATTVSGGGTLAASNSNPNLKLLGASVTVNAGSKIQTGADAVGQNGKCAYTNLTFAGTVPNPARIRIGGTFVSPTVYMTGNLKLPTGTDKANFDLSANIFKSPGTYTLVEFASGYGLDGTGGTVPANVQAVNLAAGRSATFAYVSTPNRIQVTITIP